MPWSPGLCLWARCYEQNILIDDSVPILVILTLIEFTHLVFPYMFFLLPLERPGKFDKRVNDPAVFSWVRSFENLFRLINIPLLPPSHTASHPRAGPFPAVGRFQNVLGNLLRRQVSLLCICQLFWVYKWLTCFPRFLRPERFQFGLKEFDFRPTDTC